MKKRNKIWGLLLLSGMLLTGCLDDNKPSNIVDNNSNVSENNGDVNSNDNNNDENNENEENDSGENQGEEINQGNEGGNEGSEYGSGEGENQGNQGGNEGNENQGEENNQGNENGNEGGENQGNEGNENNQGGNEGGENQGNEGGENQGNEGNENGNEGGEGGETAKTDWDADEKALLDEFFYGLDIPYYYFEGEENLDYYEDHGTAFKFAEGVGPEALEAYYDLFDESWYDGSSTDSYHFYLENQFDFEDGFRIVAVEFFAGDANGDPVSSGEGDLYFMIYEPYYYEWPELLFEYFTEDFELTNVVPAYEGAYYYETVETYYDFGFLTIYCYTDSSTAEEDYLAALGDAGFVFDHTDEYGYDLYVDPNGEFYVSFAYDPDYEDLDIYVELIFDEELELDGDTLDREAFGIANSNDTAYVKRTATGASGATYEGLISAGTGVQLNAGSSKKYGIVSTTSGGLLLAVGVVWNSKTQENKELQIYASNEPFDIADMYDSETTKCEYVASLYNNGSVDPYLFEAEYTYIGIRSKNGAIYLDELIIVWDNGEEEPEDDEEEVEVPVPVGDEVIGVE